MATRKPTATVQLKVRLREELRAMLEAEAKERAVSLNQVIVDRLTDSFDPRGMTAMAKAVAFLTEQQHALDAAFANMSADLRKLKEDAK